jgi:hypothetical protein
VEEPLGGRIKLEQGEGVTWRRGRKPQRIVVGSTRFQHRRHRRKYAEGTLLPEEMFYFRGPEGKLNLMAQNLALFAQTAAGVDDETWQYHLKRHDYSNWFRDVIKDPDLADEAAPIERKCGIKSEESRRQIIDAITRRYTVSIPEPAERQDRA